MFHYNPRYSSSDMFPYTFIDSPSSMTCDPTFDAYDARRNRLEQIALARRQQERRAAEEAAWVQQQRRRAALEAAIEEEEERQHMIRQHELYRQRRAREIQLARERAAEEEYLRRKLAQRQHQMEIQRQQHEQERQQQQHLRQRVEQPQPQAGIEVHPLESLLRAFFGQDSTSEKPAQENVKATSSPADQPQTQPTFEASTAPAAESDNSAPAATAEDPAEQLFVHDTPNDADYESSSAEEEDAASTLQRHYRTHLHRRQALSTLSSLADSLKSQQASFILPETLTFQPSPASSTNDGADNEEIPAPSPRLAFSPSNAPLLAYEDFLVRLLSKIDAVSSGGDRTIKRARKDLVKAVNDELSQLDEARDRAWKEQQERAAVLPTEPAAERMNVEMTEAAEPESDTVQEAITSSATQATASESASSPELPAPEPEPVSATESPSPPVDQEEDDGHDSDSTLSVDSVEVNTAIDDIVRQARKLGEQVEKLERAEVNNSPAGEEQFVMV